MNITRNVGMILLAVFLLLVGLTYLAVTAIPPVALGVVAIASAIFILIGR